MWYLSKRGSDPWFDRFVQHLKSTKGQFVQQVDGYPVVYYDEDWQEVCASCAREKCSSIRIVNFNVLEEVDFDLCCMDCGKPFFHRKDWG